MKNLDDFLYDFRHDSSNLLLQIQIFYGGCITRWLGRQFLNGLYKQRWQAGCWLHQCVLRNTLAGSKTWFRCPGMTL